MNLGERGREDKGGRPGTCPGCRFQPLIRVPEDAESPHWWLCPDCSSGFYVWANEEGPPRYEAEYGTCRVCWHDKPRKKLIEHHSSYHPERIVTVCGSCHHRIHNDVEFRPDLTPDVSRSDAERRGYV